MKTLREKFEEARERMMRNGYLVSAGSWIDEENDQFYVCSDRSLPECYGHPCAEISSTGWTSGITRP